MSSSYSSACSPPPSEMADGCCMARGEVEVAKVLASLGRTNSVESYGGDDGGDGRWGSKGKRSNKRVKESQNSNLTLECNSLPLPFDLNVDQAALLQEECGNDSQLSVEVKTEQVCESVEPHPVANASHRAGRSRQHLTEAEKEARRIRRILANRESARQTIRRRQALYEELTRKAAELLSENENLKRSKNLAVEEYQSLQTSNRNLKEQISRAIGFELGNNGGEAKSTDTEAHSVCSSSWPRPLCDKFLSTPFVFPAYVQDTPQLTHPSSPFSSKVVMPTFSPCLMPKEESNQNINDQNKSWCIVPCPWFLPVATNTKSKVEQFFSFDLTDQDTGTVVDAKDVYSPSSSSAAGVLMAGSQSERGKQNTLNICKNKGDTMAGVKARKRRRELIKLKSLHYR